MFRNIETRTIVLQGVVDRVKWSIAGQSMTFGSIPETEVEDVLELMIPPGFSMDDMGVVERFTKGRVLLTFPNE